MLHWYAGSRKNIEEHYDAGNAMYKLFLDDSMMYSSAVHVPGEDLYEVGILGGSPPLAVMLNPALWKLLLYMRV
jgi:hypothetical protein